jgi:hypothetical protein
MSNQRPLYQYDTTVESMETKKRCEEAEKRIVDYMLSGFVDAFGNPIPRHTINFKEGDLVKVGEQTFRVAYVGSTYMVIEPASPTSVKIEGAGGGV